uniref:Unconventional myosin-XVIIIa n=1 Tax=Syphacia muris TaxID=451379 RepID=A0A158R4R5_9BILA
MFFHRKKDKEERKDDRKKIFGKDSFPVIGKKPPLPPPPHLLNNGTTDSHVLTTVEPSSSTSTLPTAAPTFTSSPPVPVPRLRSEEKSAEKHNNNDQKDDNEKETYAEYVFPVLKDLPKLSLPALAPVQVNQRTLVLQRNIYGGFGFNIRRTQHPDKQGCLRPVVFVEPTEIRYGPPRPSEMQTSLLPGDQLIMINKRHVETMGREELQHLIQSSTNAIELTVMAMPELAELCDRRSRGIRDSGDSLMLPTVNHLFSDQEIPEDERYWLMHRNGYTLARRLQTTNDGKMKIAVCGMEMLVDVTDVDKANPISADRTEDLANLRYINETSAIHVLRHRFGSNLLYTNGGSDSILYVASNYKQYLSNKLMSLFKGCRRQQMPPHIYSVSQQSYRSVQMTGRNQCLVLTGVTGSGKTMQLRNICHYLCEVAGWTQVLTYEKISFAIGVLETFGNCMTQYSKNASRFVQLISLCFDSSASLKMARIQTFLLESTRVVSRPAGESNFHIFSCLLEGADPDLIEKTHLDAVGKPVRTQMTGDEDKEAAQIGWSRVMEALQKLGATDNERQGICNVLAAILHLCYAEATQCQASRAQFVRATNAQYAASLLGVPVDQLSNAVFRGGNQTMNSSSINRFSMSHRTVTGQDALNNFISTLYSQLFAAVVMLLNRGLANTNQSVHSTISILDYPGNNFNSAWIESDTKVSGLTDLIYNYLNERIAELCYEKKFTEPLELYAREHVDVDLQAPHLRPHYVTRLIDQKQQLVNCVDIEMRSEEKRGLLYILDEEAFFPGATDDSFFERIFIHFDESRIIRRGSATRQFVIGHGIGTSQITYSVNGWIKAAQAGPTDPAALLLLHESRDSAVNSLFASFGIAETDSAALKLRKATQTVKLDGTGPRTASAYFGNIAAQVDYIISIVRRAFGVQFVHCIQPLPSPLVTINGSDQELFDVPFVRSQLQSMLIVDSVRASNRGYPERMSFKDFLRRFQCLVEQEENSLSDVLDDRAAVGRLLEKTGIFAHHYKLGLSQVLLRNEAMADLEERRELCLSGLIISLQRVCRKYLAKKWLIRKRVLDTAIRCVQRNGRTYLKVREWPWWRLYVRVLPLLDAARSDEEFREWKQKLSDLEGTCSELRAVRSRLEGRVSELEQMLLAEVSNSQSLTESLEHETENRVAVQKQLFALQQRHPEDSRLSLSASSHSRLDQMALVEKSPELHKELVTLRESEAVQRSAAQKTLERLKDVENELQDLRARNEALEKRNAGFDNELKTVNDNCQKEKSLREKVEQEKYVATATLEKKTVELQNLKVENGELRQNLAKLRKEMEESSEQSSDVNENELSNLRKIKRQLEARCVEQEDELDELQGKVQSLQQTVTRLEMAAERARSERTRDMDAKESEIDEIRAQYQRRVRAFEEQIADLQDTNSSMMKQNRMLEARIRDINSQNCSSESSYGRHYKRDLKKALALLRDTQAVLAHERETAANQVLLRQLQEQLDDAETAKLSALKGRHHLESELAELKTQLDEALAAKNSADDKALVLLKEKNSALALVEEHDEQLQSLMKKYKAAIQQAAIDSIKIADQYEQMSELEKQKERLHEELNEVSSALEFRKNHSVEKHKLQLAEQKIRDIEGKLELEIMQKHRLDNMLVKANDELESLRDQLAEAIGVKEKEIEAAKKARKELLVQQDQFSDLKKREAELVHRCQQLAMDLEKCETEKKAIGAEHKLALRRIEDLQTALNNDLSDNDEDLSEDEETSSSRNESLTG